MTGRLLTARQVAERLGFAVDTIHRWTREGKLSGIRISGTKHGRLRYREDDLEELLAERVTGAADRGGVSQPQGRAQSGGYVTVESLTSANPPRDAAPTEEKTDATR